MSSTAQQLAGQEGQPISTPPATPGQITPQILVEQYGMSEEQAIALMQALPTICGGVQQPIPPASFNTGDQGALSPTEQQELREFILAITEEMQEFPEMFQGQIQPQLQQTQGQPGQIPQRPFQQQQQQQPPLQFPWQQNSADDQGPKVRIMQDGNQTKLQMIDSITMDIVPSSIAIDQDGNLTADAVMTAAMVQDYSGKKVLKCPDELLKACGAWPAPLPATNQHPEEGMVMNQDEIVGWTTPPTWDDQNKNVRCSMEIRDAETIKAIQEGKTDVSIGFFCDLDETAGDYGGTQYSAVQRNIVFNHLAVGLDKGRGRCPDGTCGIQGDAEITSPEGGGTSGEACPCCAHYDEMCEFITKDAQLTSAQRKALPPETFCGPERSFPVPDCAHYTAALRLLGRYQGPGDKTEIKACIEARGKTMNCPTAEDQESLHAKLIQEQTKALTRMCESLSTQKDPEDFETIFDGIRELIWKLKDNLRIAAAMELTSVDKKMRTEAALALGDAAILQHKIETRPGTKQTSTVMKAGRYELLPGMPDTHKHSVDLDTEGNGTSTVTDDHSHKVVAKNVQLSNGHTHQLSPLMSQEETPMDEKNKTPKKEEDKVDPPAKVDTPPADPPTEEPTTEAPSDKDEVTPPAVEEPPEKDAATLYVESIMNEEHTKLVDSIMDFNPPQERKHYEDKSLDELRELAELLNSQRESDGLPAAAAPTGDSDVVDDAYAKLEEKLQSRS